MTDSAVETELRRAAVDPCSDPRWSDLAATQGRLFESPAWLAAIRDAFGVTPEATILVDESDRTVAGLAVGRVDDALGLRFSTFPFSDYNDPIGPLADDEAATLLAPWIDGAAPYAIRTRRDDLASGAGGLSERGRAAWHQVDLTPDRDELWAGLAGGARQNVRRSQRVGLTIEVSADRRALAGFHEIHLELRRRKYEMLAQPVEYFDALHHHLTDDLVVLTASIEGSAVAAFVLIRHGDTAYYKLGSSMPEAGPARASDALLWRSICFAKEEWGCSSLDLGLSDLDQPGLLRFKAKYATTEGEIVSYRSSGEAPAHEQEIRGMMNGLTQALTTGAEVPASVLRDASSRLYRYFC